MKSEDRFDQLIRQEVAEHFPALLRDLGAHAWLWIKAQAWQESRLNPNATSPVGAAGLLQLMPATDREIDGDLDGHDPVGNVDNGVRYMAFLYVRFSEIPWPGERLKFAFAGYNGGRGYVNKALELARADLKQPAKYFDWRAAGSPAGHWQKWDFTRCFLTTAECSVNGRRPDWRQIHDYVDRIEERYRHYLQTAQPSKESAA